MATKKKAAKKAAPKARQRSRTPNPDAQIIQISPTGATPEIHVSASATKFPNKVYWIPVDNRTWAIILNSPPAPFLNGNGPIKTGVYQGTGTRLLNVDPNLGGTGPYTYDTAVITSRGPLNTYVRRRYHR